MFSQSNKGQTIAILCLELTWSDKTFFRWTHRLFWCNKCRHWTHIHLNSWNWKQWNGFKFAVKLIFVCIWIVRLQTSSYCWWTHRYKKKSFKLFFASSDSIGTTVSFWSIIIWFFPPFMLCVVFFWIVLQQI